MRFGKDARSVGVACGEGSEAFNVTAAVGTTFVNACGQRNGPPGDW